jgi:hypothetical protein
VKFHFVPKLRRERVKIRSMINIHAADISLVLYFITFCSKEKAIAFSTGTRECRYFKMQKQSRKKRILLQMGSFCGLFRDAVSF